MLGPGVIRMNVGKRILLLMLGGALAVAASGCDLFADSCLFDEKCPAGKICDPDEGWCVAPCTAGSCEWGRACLPSGLCTHDCRAEGALCGEGEACDLHSSMCVDACGDETCGEYEVCDAELRRCMPFCDFDYGFCENGRICNPQDHRCVAPCTPESCEQSFCGPEGLCVDALDECPPPTSLDDRAFPNWETNTCEPPPPADCAAAALREDLPEAVQGPVAHHARVVSFNAVQDAACVARRAVVRIAYYDPAGRFEQRSGNALNGSVKLRPTGEGDARLNTPVLPAGRSDGRNGVIEFSLCVEGSEPLTFAAFLRNQDRLWGNPVCFTIDAAAWGDSG